MSNFLAIATVTATLSQLLQDAVPVDVPGADVRTVRPDKEVPDKGVNIFLYQVTPNTGWRNADLPARRADGQLTQRPRAALNLDYLLTFYGEELELEPQRLLGSVVRTLHTRPMLTRQKIQETIANPTFSPFLATSDLADEVELIKFTPLTLSLDELSKLWSVFFQTPYALSVAYQGTVVLIEGSVAPRATLPVRERTVTVLPFSQPVVSAVEPPMVEFAPGAQISLRGQHLLAADTIVQVGGLEVVPAPESTDTRLVVGLPAGARAGVTAVRVVQRLLLGAPTPTPHRGFESNVAAFVLQPRLNSVSSSDGGDPRITATVTPAVGLRQQATLLLNQIATPPPAAPLAFTLSPRARAAETDPLVFDATAVTPATYLARVRVDGAESALTVDTDETHATFNQYIGPTVTIP
jgi:hypothetical protein